MKKLIPLLMLCSVVTAFARLITIVEPLHPNAEYQCTIKITPGEHWFHKLRVFPLISVKNAPQIAIWLEDSHGRFLQTLFVTYRAGTNTWRKAPGDAVPKAEIRRPAALPVWRYAASRSTEQPLAITGATPRYGAIIICGVDSLSFPLIIKAEVNHSTDFNEFFPQDATPADPGYSNGSWGSGQPALVYAARINAEEWNTSHQLTLLGHSNPHGKDGNISNEEMQTITTAHTIIEGITIKISKENK